MTLFSRARDDPDNPFRRALDRWCGGRADEYTLALMLANELTDVAQSLPDRTFQRQATRRAVAAANPIAAPSDKSTPSAALLYSGLRANDPIW